MRNDYTVSVYERSSYKYLVGGEAVRHAGKRWAVRGGGEELVAVKHAEEEAEALAENLNRDTWFLDRGYTAADRAAGY